MGDSCVWVRFHSLSRDGELFEFEWAAWVADGNVWWDLPGVCDTIRGKSDADEPVHRWFKNRRQSFDNAWSWLGLREEDVVLQSERAWKARPRAADDPIQDESKCASTSRISSSGVLLLLVFCMSFRHTKEGKQRVERVFLAWCDTLLVAPADLGFAHAPVAPAVIANCPGVEEGAPCAHLAGSIALLLETEGSPQRAFAAFAKHLLPFAALCGACRSHAIDVVMPGFQACVVQQVPAVAFTDDAIVASYSRPHKKQKHYHPDFGRAVLAKVEAKRAASAPAFLRSHGHGGGKVAESWLDRACLEHQSAGWCNAGEVQVVSMSADVGRIGNPAEDTEAVAIWCWGKERDFAVWAPPQVFGRWTVA